MSLHSSLRAFCAIAIAYAASSLAIEAPKPAAAAIATPENSNIVVAATDESAFYEVLQRTAQRRMLSGLRIPDDVIASLARGQADVAVNALSTAAASGKLDENIALVRIQHWCNRMVSGSAADPQPQIDKLGSSLPPEKAARAAGVLLAEVKYRTQAREGCQRARFDYSGIEARLRAAAAAGDPASATELSQFTRDPARKQAMLEAAANKNFAPAQHALATQRLIAVQRSENTDNVASIRTLFKQAGRTMPKAKLELANCMAVGCDGYPADTPAASAFGLDAARDGEPTAFVSMVRMPWGQRLTQTQLLGWQYFGERLNEAGCNGDAYVSSALTLHQTIQARERNQEEKALAEAKMRAEDLWRENGDRARKEQGCG